MGTGMEGTFQKDARRFGMSASDVATLVETLNPKGDKGWVPYEFNKKRLKAQYKHEEGNLIFLAIAEL